MNKTIWKFKLTVTDHQVIEMPVDSEILTIQVQGSDPYLWALVNSDKSDEKVNVVIETFGTGHNIPYDMGVSRYYLGTYQLLDGSLVYHVFEYTGK